MVWGGVSQRLVVTNLPDGVKMYITDVELFIPEGDNQWWPTFGTRTELIYKYTTPEKKKSTFPLKVSPTISHGLIGEASLTSTSMFDSGDGPSIRIDFLLTGTLNANTEKPLPVGQKGSVTISTPPWGGFWSGYSNPKQIMLAYNLIGGDGDSPGGLTSSLNVQVDIPVSGHTKELHLNIVPSASSSGGEINGLGLKVAPEDNWAFDFANLLLGGVYKAHEIGYGWVFGALGGWPAAVGLVGGEELRKLIYG
ncbi:hypothetical protein N0V85_008435 [Neurospora sp. IMI 360204]|nr:hypothetical protein N0V85_008435 [Neurospora sp. IMI 360204]